LITLPPPYIVPAAGWVMVAVGAVLEVTVSTASLLNTLPDALLTRARNRAPLSLCATDATV